MVMQRIAAAIFPHSLPETFIKWNMVDTEPTTMAKSRSHQTVLLSMIAAALRRARQAAVLLLGLALVTVPPQVVFGQSNQQQEQQQREQQERERQQRDQQQREQQERERQQRDQQQREQQEREQQQRDQQQREQQERERQQRDQQQRDQQERVQQQRDEQQREQEQVQQQQHSSSDSPAPISNASSEASRPTAHPPATDVKRTTSDIQPLGVERKINSASAVNATATKDRASKPVEPDLRRRVCEDGPCKEPAPKPVQLKPIAPDLHRKLCKNGSCQPCPEGRSKGKDGSCAPPPGPRTVVQQPCAAGQVWGGTQCLIVGAQQCLPGQSRVGTSCQADCAIPTAGAQNVIVQLRSARLRKNDICLQNPTGKECQEAEAHYDLMLNEYRNFLGGVPTECRTSLPHPIAI